MAKTPDRSTKLTALRRQAEALLRTTDRDVAAMPVKNVQQLVHELQVHQVELELQNEELRRTQLALEAARDRYVELYDFAPVGYLTLDLRGTILGANLPTCTLLGVNLKDLLGQPAIRFVAARDQATFLRHLREPFVQGISHVCEVDLERQQAAPVSVQFQSVAVPDESGQHARILTALENITGRKRAEALAREQQHGLEQQRNLAIRVGLSHDLHDGMLQSLFAIGLSFETCKLDIFANPKRASATLTYGLGAMNAAMREVRTFMEALESNPPPDTTLPGLDLSGSLRSMAKDLARLHGIPVRVSVDHDMEVALSREQSLALLKMAKEALSNSLRHARPPLVLLSLRRLGSGIRLTVLDHGTGFILQEKMGEGNGLVNMAIRAQQIGGNLSVQSSPATGTRVVLDLPAKTRRGQVSV